MNPLYALTGKKPKVSYADMVEAQAPIAQQGYYNRLSKDLEKQRLEQAQAIADANMTEQQRQFEEQAATTQGQFESQLAQTQSQADAANALTKKQISDAEGNADTANMVATGSLGLEAYPLLKQGASSLYNAVAPAASTTAAPAAATGASALGGAAASTPAMAGATAGADYVPGVLGAASETGAGAGAGFASYAIPAAAALGGLALAIGVENGSVKNLFNVGSKRHIAPWVVQKYLDPWGYREELVGGQDQGTMQRFANIPQEAVTSSRSLKLNDQLMSRPDLWISKGIVKDEDEIKRDMARSDWWSQSKN